MKTTLAGGPVSTCMCTGCEHINCMFIAFRICCYLDTVDSRCMNSDTAERDTDVLTSVTWTQRRGVYLRSANGRRIACKDYH